jgi:hypothetical protein
LVAAEQMLDAGEPRFNLVDLPLTSKEVVVDETLGLP